MYLKEYKENAKSKVITIVKTEIIYVSCVWANGRLYLGVDDGAEKGCGLNARLALS